MKNRAVSGTRTRDPRLGKPMLYQLSYYRKNRMTKIQKIGYSQQRAPKINKKLLPINLFCGFYVLYLETRSNKRDSKTKTNKMLEQKLWN